jgi:hypothetical protein
VPAEVEQLPGRVTITGFAGAIEADCFFRSRDKPI